MAKILFPLCAALTLMSCSDSGNSYKRLGEPPKYLMGEWKNISTQEFGCITKSISVSASRVKIQRSCEESEDELGAQTLKITGVLVKVGDDRRLSEHRIETEVAQVVFSPSKDGVSEVYLQLWITDDYGPIKELGKFLKF